MTDDEYLASYPPRTLLGCVEHDMIAAIGLLFAAAIVVGLGVLFHGMAWRDIFGIIGALIGGTVIALVCLCWLCKDVDPIVRR